MEALAATGARNVYVHIDLDVLDPGEFSGLGYPEPFGVSVALLLDLIRAVKDRFPLAGAAVTEFAPASPEQAATTCRRSCASWARWFLTVIRHPVTVPGTSVTVRHPSSCPVALTPSQGISVRHPAWIPILRRRNDSFSLKRG